MEKKQKNWLGKGIVIACIAAAVFSYLFIPSVKALCGQIAAMFATGDFTVVREFVASYGSYAAAVSFALMIFQSVAAPLPAFLITFANANLFLDERHGGSRRLLFYRQSTGARRGGKAHQQGRTGTDRRLF